MPVCPRTPGVMTDTCRNKSSPAAFVSSFGICRVAKIPRATAGPNASGVISVFPSPAANISPSLSGSRYSSSSLIISLKFSGSSNEISGNSSVIYLPRGLAEEPFLLGGFYLQPRSIYIAASFFFLYMSDKIIFAIFRNFYCKISSYRRFCFLPKLLFLFCPYFKKISLFPCKKFGIMV